ncbi:hypothetical protein BC829DRAFT_285133 [Chytridium lagenaria]|nr:hypothetical protein BC829DRAFT_285133 [Chytridium lagenaria]
MLAESTTTAVLDEIIEAQPGVPAYYRTRAMIHGFREEYSLALKDFKTAISVARRGRQQHSGKLQTEDACCENQLVFLRGACYHQYALSLMEKAIQGVNKKRGYNPNKGNNVGGKPTRNEIPFAAIDYNPNTATNTLPPLTNAPAKSCNLPANLLETIATFSPLTQKVSPPFPIPRGPKLPPLQNPLP